MAVVNDVELDRYAGRWYEISSYPQRVQRGCVATTANYTLLGEGRIHVENDGATAVPVALFLPKRPPLTLHNEQADETFE